jgi:glycosyltransferase involved in cell wall biosynthesis
MARMSSGENRLQPPVSTGRGATGEAVTEHSPVTRRRRWLAHGSARAFTLAYGALLALVGRLGRRRRSAPEGGMRILLTGTFYSGGWANAHLRPLASSRRCAEVVVISAYPVPPTPGVRLVYPWRWTIRLLGATPARLLAFVNAALRDRPHVIGGFHLLVNGLLAVLLARVVGARSVYICGGGPRELAGGGYGSENRFFRRMETPDLVVERRLLRAVGAFDLVITRGPRAVDFFRQRGVDTRFEVLTGGIDGEEFHPSPRAPSCDLILVARLGPVKRIDLFLEAIRCAAQRVPDLTAVIVGDGESRPELEALARELGIAARVRFVGHQECVAGWLQQARIFVLTSDSEGLSLSLIEAMMCGLPAVVSDVGELADLVTHGTNGFLVRNRTPEGFAAPIVELLTDRERYGVFAAAAREAALRHSIRRVAARWDEILDGMRG